MIGRPKLSDGATKPIQLKIGEEEFADLEEWRFANRMESRSEAIRRLIQLGLRADPLVPLTFSRILEALETAQKLQVQMQGFDAKKLSKEQYFASVATAVGEMYGDVLDAILSAAAQSMALVNEVAAIHQNSDIKDAVAKADEIKQHYLNELEKLRGDIGAEKARRRFVLDREDEE
ncbi:hypothetical protein [Aureimonas sp. AU4]|uniref:hypothetical protein n=1 Tax=Aureimonas sp. AU4 TaxID=1638163 RepID=UPI000706A3B6|nr:hypothetical protein [Aureimonas sp. AU4]BAT30561.1 hypothetical protein [Aureimonas sp. AU4]